MDPLEKFFEKRRPAFDDAEPSDGHFARFEARMNQEFGIVEKTPRIISLNRPMIFRIAAGFIILCAFSFLLYDFLHTRSVEKSANVAVTSEIDQAINYYDDAATSRLGTLRTLACCGKEKEQIYQMASTELQNLDKNTAELKAALKANPDDERIQAAIILNQQMKVKVMNEMINQMNKVKK